MINGEITVGDQKLNNRDGFGIWDVSEINILADTNAEVLVMEVPMKVG